MPIRLRDQDSALGRLRAQAGDVTGSLTGAHTAPLGRTGALFGEMQPIAAAIQGFFQPAPATGGTTAAVVDDVNGRFYGTASAAPPVPRIGTIARTLDNTAAVLNGTFVPFVPPQRVGTFNGLLLPTGGNFSGTFTNAGFGARYPRLSAYLLGGTQAYNQPAIIAALARLDFAILSHYPGWQQSKGGTLASVVQGVKAASTRGTKVVAYIIYPEIPNVNANPGNGMWEVWQYADANNLWAYQNGLTETNRIASHEANWSKLNYTHGGKLVGGLNFVQWMIDFSIRLNRDGGTFTNGQNSLPVAANPFLDGLFFDNVFFRERSPDGDYDRNGALDQVTTSTASRLYVQQAHANAIAYYRTRWPGSTLLVNSADWPEQRRLLGLTMVGSALDQKVQGGVLEHIENYENNVGFAGCMQAIQEQMDLFLPPKLGSLETDIGSLSDYKLMRYWLGISLLTDTYYYPHAGPGYLTQDLPNTWYDEFDWNLGAPLGPPQYTPLYQAGGGGGICRRDFVNGSVLVNMRRGTGALSSADQTTFYAAVPLTHPLGGTLRAIAGTQDPVVNHGGVVTSHPASSPRDARVYRRIA